MKAMSQVTKTGIVLALVGTLLVLVAILADVDAKTREDYGHLAGRIAVELVRAFGIGALLLGVFNFILNRTDWEEYFEKRLKSIVIDQTYLASLDRTALKRLMISVIKAQAPGAAVDREGGFLEYFDTNLRQFIFDPFREGSTAEYSYAEDPTDSSRFTAVDKYSHTMRAVGNRMHDVVNYVLEKEECSSADAISVWLKLPQSAAEPGKTITLVEKQAFTRNAQGDHAFATAIPPEYALDGLEVTIEATYTVPKDRFQMWWMLAPTRDLRVIIRYPEAYDIQIKAFVQVPQLCDWTRRSGYLLFHYPSWFLPSNGVAWKFIAKPPAAQRISSAPSPASSP